MPRRTSIPVAVSHLEPRQDEHCLGMPPSKNQDATRVSRCSWPCPGPGASGDSRDPGAVRTKQCLPGTSRAGHMRRGVPSQHTRSTGPVSGPNEMQQLEGQHRRYAATRHSQLSGPRLMTAPPKPANQVVHGTSAVGPPNCPTVFRTQDCVHRRARKSPHSVHIASDRCQLNG